jgi:hypothetical protein
MSKNALSLVVVAVVGAALVGCGGSSSDGAGAATSGQVRNAPKWSEKQVMDAAGLTREDDGFSYQTASGCEVAVVMTSKHGDRRRLVRGIGVRCPERE